MSNDNHWTWNEWNELEYQFRFHERGIVSGCEDVSICNLKLYQLNGQRFEKQKKRKTHTRTQTKKWNVQTHLCILMFRFFLFNMWMCAFADTFSNHQKSNKWRKKKSWTYRHPYALKWSENIVLDLNEWNERVCLNCTTIWFWSINFQPNLKVYCSFICGGQCDHVVVFWHVVFVRTPFWLNSILNSQ